MTGSYGGLARDEFGRWIVGCYGKIHGCVSTLNAELEGILFGLNMAHEKGWNRALIESDSMEAVDLVNNEEDSHHPLANIIEDCMELKKALNARVGHIHREGNRCADWLANKGRQQQDRFVEIEEASDQILQFLMDDESGLTFERNR